MFQILLVQKSVQKWVRRRHCLLTLLDAKVAGGLLLNTPHTNSNLAE